MNSFIWAKVAHFNEIYLKETLQTPIFSLRFIRFSFLEVWVNFDSPGFFFWVKRFKNLEIPVLTFRTIKNW